MDPSINDVPNVRNSFLNHQIQRSAKVDAPGWVNAADKLGKKSYATAVMKFTKPGAPTLADLSISVIQCLQRSAKVHAPGCVNAAGKLGRSDKQQQ